MADLITSIQNVVGGYLRESGLTDMVIGTVTQIDPELQVTLEGTMLPIPKAVLVLTANVVEKTITVNGHIHNINGLSHSHTYSDGTTGSALTGTYPTQTGFESLLCTENGVPLTVNGNIVTINRGLILGDKVLMLRVLDGQKFIILSRLF